jgi:ATP-binding cassette subfamily C (CFTR/MRP) protein 1
MSLPIIGMSTDCFERIQTFLLSKYHEDGRILHLVNDLGCHSRDLEGSGIELQSLGQRNQEVPAIRFDQVAVNRGSYISDLVLQDVSFRIQPGSINMVVGVVGSGKSTLLKTALGEIQCSSGSISVASQQIAYCSQTPWLPNATIREIVRGHRQNENDDQAWYSTVMHNCAIAEDILQLPNRDETLIGSRGVTLSGGQKQRLVGLSSHFSVILD